MTQTCEPYVTLKRRATGAAMVTSGCGDAEAQSFGFKDVFDLIMSDSAHTRQATFVTLLPSILTDAEGRMLLDSLAREYAGAEGWSAYIDRVTGHAG